MTPFDTTQLRETRKAQTSRKLNELTTLSPRELDSLRRKRFAESQRLAFFYSNVEELPNGCWKWKGNRKPKSQGSYPMMPAANGKCVHAVAWAYKHIRGLEPPKRGSGLELSHQCEENGLGSRCANPLHVEPEDRRTNLSHIPRCKMLTKMRKMRAAIGKRKE